MNPITFVYNIIHAQKHARQLDELLENSVRVIDDMLENSALLEAENAALRAQIPTRGAGGRFAAKSSEK